MTPIGYLSYNIYGGFFGHLITPEGWPDINILLALGSADLDRPDYVVFCDGQEIGRGWTTVQAQDQDEVVHLALDYPDLAPWTVVVRLTPIADAGPEDYTLALIEVPPD
ncbi:DUF736 family protein [Caulobacter sp. LARHSG274]